MSIYTDWGFKQNPFETTSLPASEEGENLLVGRDQIVSSIMRRIEGAPKIATIEGLNGVGKTSVVNVAAYRLFSKRHEEGHPLFIPCRKTFQIDSSDSAADLKKKVLMEVAQTLLEAKLHLPVPPGNTKSPSNPALERWLNNPEQVSYQGGIWVLQGGRSVENNTTDGFLESGFEKAVTTWLSDIFTDINSGGVICIIDNLELLQSSDRARQTLEEARDDLLTTRGIRIVLCGALGIVHGVVSSPRLEGYLHKPVEVGEIGKSDAAKVFSSRLNAFKKINDYYMPLAEESFLTLYAILRGNLRSILSSCDDYCNFMADRDRVLPDAFIDYFDQWLWNDCSQSYDSAKAELRPKPLEIFKTACELEVFSPSDFETFGMNSVPAFRPHIRDLENVGLVVSTQDEGDKRRKTIQVTPKGWKVFYYISSSKP